MRAFFVTTATSEPRENVDSWRNTMGPAAHAVFDIDGPPQDEIILRHAADFRPDVIFYTGGTDGAGLPSDDTLRALREIAPSVILQGDMADPPWHPVLERYRAAGCFDLMVGMDGVRSSPVDHVTLTPLDLAKFDAPSRRRSIHCGFAGNHVPRARHDLVKRLHDTEDPRSAFLHALGDAVRLRERELDGEYRNYVAFLRRCRMIVNTSLAGSGMVHHMKGRILESAFAGAAMLEMRGSPIGDWFPPESYFTWGSVAEARDIIRGTPQDEIDRRAALFAAHARAHYGPDRLWRGIVAALPR